MSNVSIDNNLTVIHLVETSENLKTSQQHTRITITRKRKHQRPDYFQVHQETKKLCHPRPPPTPHLKSILQPFDSFFDSICLPTWKPSGKIIVNKEFLDRIDDWKFSNLNVEDLPQHN